MNKYIVPILVILLLLSSSFLGSSYSIEDIERTSILSFDGKTLYVGGSGPGNYSTIQDAIDDATDGDTVFVFDNSSPYYEHVIVNKSINLIGENRDTTVIDGNRNGTAVQITADWIGLSGFTIQNTSGGFPGGFQCGINLGSNYNIITGNIISNCRFFPIRLLNSNSNNITGNIISNNGCGMNIDGSSSNTITGNTISSNAQYGIRLHGWNNNNTITGNIISNNGNGINLHESSGNTITGNTISSNAQYGIRLHGWNNNNTITGNIISNNGCGIIFPEAPEGYCDNNIISGNNISSNNEYGICLYYSSSDYNNITGNTISNNENGIGLWGSSSNYNTITGNTISSNAQYGIRLHGWNNNNTITGNTISNNWDGIDLYESSSNTITGNTISLNNRYGIHLEDSSNNTIQKNNFINNKRHAFFFNCKNTWKQNYWNRPRILPKLIFGKVEIGSTMIPWINIDWRPALKPYDIGV